MKLRAFLSVHGPALGWPSTNQVIETAKVLGRGDSSAAFAAHGRGPGGGPDATPYSGALFVLAALAGGLQSRLAGTTQRLYVTRPAGMDSGVATLVGEPSTEDPYGVCPITAAPCLGDAVKAILANAALAGAVDRIEVRRGANDAVIHMRDGRSSRFVDGYEARQTAERDTQGHLRVVAAVGGVVLSDMARDLAG